MSRDVSQAKILVVDDQKHACHSLVTLLMLAGYHNVTDTTDPHTVDGLYERHDFDLILLNMNMPEKNGFAVMASLKHIERHGYLPVIAITGMPSLKNETLTAGARDFVTKPFDFSELLSRVRNWLEVRLLHKTLSEEAEQNHLLAVHDKLTGLPNRRLLEDRLQTAIGQARRTGTRVGVIYLDVDGFKVVNDTYGHAAGDTILKEVSNRLLTVTRAEDTVARVSGDEFVVILTGANLISGQAVPAQKILQTLSQPYVVDGVTLRLTASLGVSFFPDHGDGAKDLLLLADSALVTAKHSGKNCFIIAKTTILRNTEIP